MKADLYAMTASRTTKTVALKLNTSLCYNPDIERLTITIYDVEGLEVPNFSKYFTNVALDLSKYISTFIYSYFIKYL